jgi:hypothetical protein
MKYFIPTKRKEAKNGSFFCLSAGKGSKKKIRFASFRLKQKIFICKSLAPYISDT